MNRCNYIKYVVSLKNCWEKGRIINYCDMKNCVDNNFKDWNMKVVENNDYSKYMENYYIGYNLLPYDNFNYLRYNKSLNCSWVNNDWLPFWGYLTELKSKLVFEVKFYWILKILKIYNINDNIIFKIKEKLKKKYL